MINGNEDCLAKCEWPASEDIDGRMDGWSGGSVWTDGHCIGHRRRVASARNPNVFNVQRLVSFYPSLSLPRRANPPTCAFLLPHLPFHTRLLASSHREQPVEPALLSRGGFISAECSPSTKAAFPSGCWKSRI